MLKNIGIVLEFCGNTNCLWEISNFSHPLTSNLKRYPCFHEIKTKLFISVIIQLHNKRENTSNLCSKSEHSCSLTKKFNATWPPYSIDFDCITQCLRFVLPGVRNAKQI